MYRKERMESLMRDLLSEEVVRHIEQPDALITIMSVVISNDLEKATIVIAVYPDEKKQGIVRRLNERAGDLAYLLLKKMRVRKIPLLEFA